MKSSCDNNLRSEQSPMALQNSFSLLLLGREMEQWMQKWYEKRWHDSRRHGLDVDDWKFLKHTLVTPAIREIREIREISIFMYTKTLRTCTSNAFSIENVMYKSKAYFLEVAIKFISIEKANRDCMCGIILRLVCLLSFESY